MRILAFSRASDATKEGLLKQAKIFSRLNDRQIRKVARLFVPRRYDRGEILVRKGDSGLGMFLITSGSLEVFDPASDGRRIRLATLGPGDCVGEMSLLDERPRSATVETLQPVECLLMTRDSFNSLTKREPEILWGIVPVLVDRLRHADTRLALDNAVDAAEARSVDAAAARPVPVASAPVHASTESKSTDDDDKDDEPNGKKSDGDSVFNSMMQLSTASFMFMSSAMLIGMQESLRPFWSRSSLGDSFRDTEKIVSSMTTHIEDKMTPEGKRLFEAFEELMSSIANVFEK